MTKLVVAYTPGANRTDGGGQGVGVFFTYTGSNGAILSRLGMLVGTGNTGNAVISLSSGGASNNGTLNAQCTVPITGVPAGTWVFGSCPPYPLVTARAYCLSVAIGAGQNYADSGAVSINSGTVAGAIDHVTPGNGSGVGFSGGAIMKGGVDAEFGATAFQSTFFF